MNDARKKYINKNQNTEKSKGKKREKHAFIRPPPTSPKKKHPIPVIFVILKSLSLSRADGATREMKLPALR